MPRFFEGVMQGIRTKRNVRILNDTHLSSSLLFLCIYLFMISLSSFFGIRFPLLSYFYFLTGLLFLPLYILSYI